MYRHQGMAVVTVSCEAPGDFDGTATRCCNGTVLIGEGNAPLATGGHDWENQFVDRVWTYWPHLGRRNPPSEQRLDRNRARLDAQHGPPLLDRRPDAHG